jgi:teichuronic acid biosynthesis protein TuaE
MISVKPKITDNKLLQVLSSVILSIFFALSIRGLSNGPLSQKELLLLSVFLAVVVIAGGLFFRKVDWEYTLLYLFIATSFFNAGVMQINVGFFSFFPYRIFFIGLMVFFTFKLIKGNVSIYQSKVKLILYFFLFWFGYGCLALAWSQSITDGIRYLFLLFIGIMLVMFVNVYFTSHLHYLNFFYIWIFMTAILLMIGLWNNVTQQHLAISSINFQADYKQHVPTAVFVNQNDYATFLAISTFFLFSFAKYSKNTFAKLTGYFLLSLSIYLIYITSSRASILGLLIGVAMYLFLISPRKIKKVILILGTLGAASGLVIFSGKVFSLFGRVQSLFGYIPPSEMNSNSIRINLAKNAFDFIATSFGFGVGPGNSEYYLEHFAKYNTTDIFIMHNWWLEIFTNFGLLIFVGYVLMFATLIISFYKFYKKPIENHEKMIVEALLFGLITFIVSSISPSSVANLFYHWLLIAFSVGFLNYLRNKSENNARNY